MIKGLKIEDIKGLDPQQVYPDTREWCPECLEVVKGYDLLGCGTCIKVWDQSHVLHIRPIFVRLFNDTVELDYPYWCFCRRYSHVGRYPVSIFPNFETLIVALCGHYLVNPKKWFILEAKHIGDVDERELKEVIAEYLITGVKHKVVLPSKVFLVDERRWVDIHRLASKFPAGILR